VKDRSGGYQPRQKLANCWLSVVSFQRRLARLPADQIAWQHDRSQDGVSAPPGRRLVFEECLDRGLIDPATLKLTEAGA